MLKFVIGPILVGGGWAAGSYYGADAEQLVHKSPAQSYAAIEQALGSMKTSGMTSFEGGTPEQYEIKVDRTLDEKLIVTLFFNGRQGAEAQMDFVPEDGGKSTVIKAHIHADRSVLRTALAGTDKARLAYAPDWMLNLSFKPLLQQVAAQIEQGQAARIDGLSEADAEAQWEANLTEEQRDDVARWRQSEATQPAVDPDAAARNYMGPPSN
ncbi:MAG TPA: hypothetical protein VE968_09355 [Sphingomicrobium sp.]|nr:hypothetical protein [Sphingomicrobium sp.]